VRVFYAESSSMDLNESVNQGTNEDNDFYDEGPIEDVAN
jgi:hypothetical protein